MTKIVNIFSKIIKFRPASEKNYIAEIDGLRALAVIPVILFHANVEVFENGFLGVDMFFVISGFLITSLITRDKENDPISLLEFYQRRTRRIMPALIVVMAGTAAMSVAITTPVRMVEIAKTIVASTTFWANFWFLGHNTYFATPSTHHPLIHIWSLSVEEQFYILFPFVLILLSRFQFSYRSKFITLTILAIASIGYSQYLSATQADSAFFRPDTRAWELLLGSLCTFCPPLPTRWKGGVVLVGIALIFLAYFVLPRPQAPNLLSLPACLGASLVILGAGGKSLPNRMLSTGWLVFLGLISYSLYLWHQPLLALARIEKLEPLSGIETATVLAISFILAISTWYFVEIPTRNRDLVSARKIVTGAVVGTVALLSFSIFAISTTGFIFRYEDGMARYLATIDPLDDLGSARKAAIRMGVCHFRKDMSPPIEDFLANWHCTGGRTGRGILVVGDSHAADIAAGFMLNGVEIGQMTGAGCGLAPKYMSRDCQKLFEHISDHGAEFKMIIMANDQTGTIYSKSDIDDIMAYWGKMHLPIIWMSDMPHFPGINDMRIKNKISYGSDMTGDYPILLDDARLNYKTMNDMSEKRFQVIDSSEIYCSISSDNGRCLPYSTDAGWLAFASGHLTAVGSRLFVKKLLIADQWLK